jgi:hypothetical protein
MPLRYELRVGVLVQVIDGPLVNYFESCRADLQQQGFHVLILALVREADAPLFYDDLIRYWDSINDVTGRHVVFAVASGPQNKSASGQSMAQGITQSKWPWPNPERSALRGFDEWQALAEM